MSSVERSGTFPLGDLLVKRLGYGAMRLSGPGIFGPPRDREMAARGCFAVRHSFLSFRVRRRWRIFERTSPRRGWIYQTR